MIAMPRNVKGSGLQKQHAYPMVLYCASTLAEMPFLTVTATTRLMDDPTDLEELKRKTNLM